MSDDLDLPERLMVRAAHRWGRMVGNDLAGAAQRRAPIEEGTLRASADVDVDERLDGVDVEVSFSTPYAARQHEETGWSHPRGGEAHYLQNPLMERLPRYERALELAVAQALS